MTATNENWFTVEEVDCDTFILSEYRHPEETHCYLLCGKERALLIDTGLGISNIAEQVQKLTDKPVAAVATHVHWDHIGGHKQFKDFYAHGAELDWLNGQFPLPLHAVRNMVLDGCDPPSDFDIRRYELFRGTPTRILCDGDLIDLGGRTVQVLHTPGHAPGHMCFWEAERGYLFTGDLIYRGTLFAHYPSTDPAGYLRSVELLAEVPARRIFPAHHSLDIRPELVLRVRDALRELNRRGKLCHGSGTFDFGDWAICL